MNVLDRMLVALVPGGLVLDLQVIRPNPPVEADGQLVCELDGEPMFEWADAATVAIDARVATGELVEESVDVHEVLKHYPGGADLVESLAGARERLRPEDMPTVRALDVPLVVRQLCRLRRLRLERPPAYEHRRKTSTHVTGGATGQSEGRSLRSRSRLG